MRSDETACCGTCKHWNVEHESTQPITCTLLSRHEAPRSEEGAVLFSSPVPGARTRTGGSFVCGLHEERAQ